jgi:hypothetical protein
MAGQQAAFVAASVFAALGLITALTLLGKRSGRDHTEQVGTLVASSNRE